jgi:hypothetical protein
VFHPIVPLVGAVLILVACGLNRRAHLGPVDAACDLMDLAGATLPRWVGAADRRAGFVVVEGVWAVTSPGPLLRRARPGRTV